MIIVNSLRKKLSMDECELNYSYRLTKTLWKGQDVYGVEIERADYIDDIVINIERDSVNLISPDKMKVNTLVEMLYKYGVSPIHLIDIIGESVDQMVKDFKEVVCTT